jgi:hypothetical protein
VSFKDFWVPDRLSTPSDPRLNAPTVVRRRIGGKGTRSGWEKRTGRSVDVQTKRRASSAQHQRSTRPHAHGSEHTQQGTPAASSQSARPWAGVVRRRGSGWRFCFCCIWQLAATRNTLQRTRRARPYRQSCGSCPSQRLLCPLPSPARAAHSQARCGGSVGRQHCEPASAHGRLAQIHRCDLLSLWSPDPRIAGDGQHG